MTTELEYFEEPSQGFFTGASLVTGKGMATALLGVIVNINDIGKNLELAVSTDVTLGPHWISADKSSIMDYFKVKNYKDLVGKHVMTYCYMNPIICGIVNAEDSFSHIKET